MAFKRAKRQAAAVQKFDLGGALAKVVPALQVPYIDVQQAPKLQYQDIDLKMAKKSEDNLKHLNDDIDKIWNERMKSLDLLPVYQEQLNKNRMEFLDMVKQKVTTDGAYLGNTANAITVKQLALNMLDSKELSQMKANTKDFASWYDEKKAAHKEDDVYRDINGRASGMTNRERYQLLRGGDTARAREVLGFGTGNSAVGSMDLNAWNGQLSDADSALDKISGLVHASTKSGKTGSFAIAPEYSAQFGSNYPAIRDWMKSGSSESNADMLTHMAKFWGNDWTRKLDKNAVQGITDHFYNNYNKSAGYNHAFKDNKTNQVFNPGDARASEVEKMAREGRLKDSEKILQRINEEREKYILQHGGEYVKERILGRAYTSVDTQSTQNLQVIGAGSADKEKAAAEGSSEWNLANRNVEANGTSFVNADGGDNINYGLVAPTKQTMADRAIQYPTGMPITNIMGVRGLALPGRPTMDLSAAGLNGADNIRVRGYKADAIRPGELSPRPASIRFAMSQTNDAQQKALLQQQLGQVYEEEKNKVQHIVRVVMPLEVYSQNSHIFNYKDQKTGTVRNATRPSWGGVGALWGGTEFDSDVDGDGNAHKVKNISLSNQERVKLGYAPAEDDDEEKEKKFVEVEMMVSSSANDLQNDPKWKGQAEYIAGQRKAQADGESHKSEQYGKGLYQFGLNGMEQK